MSPHFQSTRLCYFPDTQGCHRRGDGTKLYIFPQIRKFSIKRNLRDIELDKIIQLTLPRPRLAFLISMSKPLYPILLGIRTFGHDQELAKHQIERNDVSLWLMTVKKITEFLGYNFSRKAVASNK